MLNPHRAVLGCPELGRAWLNPAAVGEFHDSAGEFKRLVLQCGATGFRGVQQHEKIRASG